MVPYATIEDRSHLQLESRHLPNRRRVMIPSMLNDPRVEFAGPNPQLVTTHLDRSIKPVDTNVTFAAETHRSR